MVDDCITYKLRRTCVRGDGEGERGKGRGSE